MIRFLAILFVCAITGIARAADANNSRAVLPPAKRADALKLAGQVLAPRESTWKTTTAGLIDPFFRQNSARDEEKVAEVDPTAGQPERSDVEVLEAVANQIQPDGIIQDILLLGGKRYKAGAQLPVTLDGVVYTIIISAIEGKSYTLRLNEQELRRQLK